MSTQGQQQRQELEISRAFWNGIMVGGGCTLFWVLIIQIIYWWLV